MAGAESQIHAYVEEGVRLCREGEWKKALPVLASAIENRGPGEQVPGVAYSYLGYGVARFQGKHREGLKLCEHALKVQYYESDNHWNLTRIHVLMANRRLAVQALERGLKLDPDHSGLLAVRKEIGMRRQPVFGFLDRRHPVNILLGRIRHGFSR